MYIIHIFLYINFFDRARQFPVANAKCLKLLTSVIILCPMLRYEEMVHSFIWGVIGTVLKNV